MQDEPDGEKTFELSCAAVVALLVFTLVLYLIAKVLQYL
jgi:hypothetical protein